MSHTTIESSSPSSPIIESMRKNVRGDVLTDPVLRGIYATDASHYQQTPTCVVVPLDEADCVAAMRVAHEHRMPITPRGAATALSGQTFGTGMVIDVSKHLDEVLEINADEKWARVQPGVVRDRLNAQLKPLGLQFAPDPATGSRATVGGMVGNNSSGTRSIVYGKTIDHVLSCRVALADGTVIDCEPRTDEQWQQLAAGNGREAGVYGGVKTLLLKHQDEVRARYPKVMRRVSGYNLDAFVDGAGYTGPIGDYDHSHSEDQERPWNLSNLIVGSEGTLGLLLEAKIRLVPLPEATAVCVVHFNDDLEALRLVPHFLEYHPSAVELLDRSVLKEAKVNPATRDLAWWIQGDPAAVLLTEFFGSPEQVAATAEAFGEALRQQGIGYAHPVMVEASEQRDVWETRKLGLGLISNVKGPVKGQAFVEDACVPIEHLAGYIEKLQNRCREEGVAYSMYAHASVGVIHFRPALDLHRPEHRDAMQRIAEFAFDECIKLGGTFAGEHGDGIVRGQFIPRAFGDQLYQAFRELKGVFDPHGLMNPGKVVDSPAMTDASILRYGSAYRLAEVPSLFRYEEQGGFPAAVEQCNGVGACRKLGSGTMCPSYIATRDEKDTTRGRANALRLAMSGQLGDNPSDVKAALASDGVHDVLDLCLSCKACKSECPNAVDMSRLKADALQIRHDQQGTPLGYRVIGSMPDMARHMRGPIAWLSNAVNRFGPYRRLFEKLTGIDRRRPLPPFAPRHLDRELQARDRNAKDKASHKSPQGDVALFVDTYTKTMEPHVGVAAVDLLEGLGYRVTVFDNACCQRPRLSKGLVRDAKKHGEKTMRRLDEVATDGLPILCLEPSCASALRDDLPDLIENRDVGQRVAPHVTMIDVFLESRGAKLQSRYPDILLHGHCHQKALFGTAAIKRLFAAMPDVQCEEVDSGCCGMAGSFGYEHHDLSQTIGEDRLFPAVRDAVAQGKTIVACGISCRHQLHDFLGVRAKHWVEVVEPAPSMADISPANV